MCHKKVFEKANLRFTDALFYNSNVVFTFWVVSSDMRHQMILETPFSTYGTGYLLHTSYYYGSSCKTRSIHSKVKVNVRVN